MQALNIWVHLVYFRTDFMWIITDCKKQILASHNYLGDIAMTTRCITRNIHLPEYEGHTDLLAKNLSGEVKLWIGETQFSICPKSDVAVLELGQGNPVTFRCEWAPFQSAIKVCCMISRNHGQQKQM